MGTSFFAFAAAAQPLTPFRIGFSESMFTDVNENDAKAAIRAWGLTVARNRGIPVEPEPVFFRDAPAMLAALEKKEVDVLAVSIVEYDFLRRKVKFDPLFSSRVGRELAVEYLLVAHRSGPVRRFRDLAGRHIQLSQQVRFCLASRWLDKLLAEQGLRPLESFAGRITQKNELSQLLLPVFFRQVDACVVTRQGFETMAELNPQLGQQLAVIASSPPFLPALFAFRADFTPPYREDLLESLRTLHQSAAGRQVLLLFNSGRVEELPVSSLETALELLASHSQQSKKGLRP